MKLLVSLFCCLTMIVACKTKKDAGPASTQSRFDKTKWLEKDGGAYPNREAMISFLIDSVTLKGLHYDSVINLLGKPDRVNEGHLYYHVDKKEVGAVTFGTKAFVLKLKADSTVEWRKTYGM